LAKELKNIASRYKNHKEYIRLVEGFQRDQTRRFLISGLAGSSKSLISAGVIDHIKGIHLFIFGDKEEAAFFYNDLLQFFTRDTLLFFPSSFKRSVQFGRTDNGNLLLRTNALSLLSEYKSEKLIVVTYPEAIFERVTSRQKLTADTLKLHAGENVDLGFIREILESYRFELVDFVYEPGQYAIRGSIIDIFSFSAEFPYRIDFFGNEVDSIRSFDVENQLSKGSHQKISIIPNLQEYAVDSLCESLIGFCPEPPVVWSTNLRFVEDRMLELEKSLADNLADKNPPGNVYRHHEIQTDLANLTTIEFGSRTIFPSVVRFTFNTRHQPLFKKNFTLLGDNLKQLLAQNYEAYILSENKNQIGRLSAIFEDTHQGIPFNGLTEIIHEGFIDDDLKIGLYTDHEIFDRYHKYKLHEYYSAKASVSLKELKDLKPGDFIVHVDHGIGRFGGLERVEINGKVQESIKLVYRDNDVLYVNIHSLHRISKYKGKDDSPPKIYKLGTGAWQKLKDSTRKKVKDIARDLIALYAQRLAKKGFSFAKDTYLQEELEASFIYEDTPDQLKATQAVKSDMESSVPMDRLICGDVGFGKTEVALRAAFKSVCDNKQVAVLVPTTILALQHHTTFHDRLKDFPCRVEYISRLRKTSDQKRIMKELEEGKVDILIGTHKLLGKEIKFKDLGLLIIDEEQKFGVAAKEKLKSLKVNVDALTMTATPIPRTLQFSLMGARDLSIINTPPPNRHPIITEVHTFNETIIQEGINFEVERGGQVFFIHNRIQNINEVEVLIRKLCPRAKTIVGHGQMEGAKLEEIMIDFINGDFDVLISTTIIESGLDIPNANTIFINNAQNFGLSDLHQLRGRVGRSNKRAFCYLIAPPLNLVTPESRRRLKAIEEYSDLGSGINIAMQDLDIRGAGNLLGAEQSGFIADIGFETYNRILEEALQELKENEFRSVFADQGSRDPKVTEPVMKKFTADCTIDTDLEIHLPEKYIESISERIRLYRQLDTIENEEELKEFEKNLSDRFGIVPEPAKALLDVVKLRWLAESLGFEKLVLKNSKLIAYFISNADSAFYESGIFRQILAFIQHNPRLFRMKEGKEKLTLSCEGVATVKEAYDLLANIMIESA
jgi:transcription-repair coupling factor (superfamily II helicase)